MREKRTIENEGMKTKNCKLAENSSETFAVLSVVQVRNCRYIVFFLIGLEVFLVKLTLTTLCFFSTVESRTFNFFNFSFLLRVKETKCEF